MVGVLVPKPLGFEHDLKYSHWIESVLGASFTLQHHRWRTLQLSVGHQDKIHEDSTLSNKNQPTPIPGGPDGKQMFDPRGGADQRKLHILVTWFTACFFAI